jgi:MinD superfamily P-loop ATPase
MDETAVNNKPEELRFCRLCGKNKSTKEFRVIQLAKLGNAVVKYSGCEACDVVIHNATIIIAETVKRFVDQNNPKIMAPPEKKIIIPS